MITSPIQDDQTVHLSRFRTFLSWFFPVLIGVSLVQFGIVAFIQSPPLLLAAVATFLYGLPIFIARTQTLRGNLNQAVLLTGLGTLVFAIVMILALPDLMTAVAMLPIIALSIVLPYTDTRELRTWSIAVWLIIILIVVLGEFVRIFERPPALAISIIQLACIIPGIGLLLMLVSHFHARMRDALTQAQATNASLQEAQKRLETQVEELEAANEAKVARDYLENVVRSYSTFANQVADGNLTARLEVATYQEHDELATLGRSLNHMVESLQRMTGQVKEASTAIATAASEILSVASHQASSSAEKSAAITQTTTTAEEVKTIAHQVAQQSNRVAQEGQAALQLARQGTQAVEQTIEGMNGIRQRVESIAQTILSLSEQTQAIGTITSTVSELADQSNMLALNAAIEAARAGEQGKSFAVVAQQVRELAERSKTATVQVREILNEIQRATNAAVMATEEGTKGVEQGTKLATSAGQLINKIAEEIENSAQANVQMAASSNQATAGMDQIGQAMTAIQQATNEMVSGMRQAEQAAQDLNTLAQSLQKMIALYKIGDKIGDDVVHVS
jgi:methyl-accepting chemotaxis protein